MTQREKLIELLIDSSCCPKETDCEDCEYRENAACREEMIADYLLANGVVVLPCKVGDKVYRLIDMSHTTHNSFLIIETVCSVNPTYTNIMGWLSEIPMEQFGETIFFTKEEAEKALEKKNKKGD